MTCQPFLSPPHDNTLENHPLPMPTTRASTSKTCSGHKRTRSPVPSTTIGRKRKMSNVDDLPAQPKKKKKTFTKTSEEGKGGASKRTGKDLKPKRGKKK